MRPGVALLLLLLLAAVPAGAADVLVVQSSRAPAYEEALRGFRSTYKGSSHTVVVGDYAELDVGRLVREERPRVLLAVGDAALAASRRVRGLPVLSLMSLSFDLAKKAPMSFGGVELMPEPERYLDLCRSIGARRVGVVHDPARTGHYVEKARAAAQRAGMTLVVREVRSPRETPGRLRQLEGSVDALWMLPDSTAVTAENVEAYLLFSLEQKVPVVTFSEQYLNRGAAVSLDVDRADMGRQAGELAASVLRRTETDDAVKASPRKTTLHANAAVLRTLGLSLPVGDHPVLR